MNHGLTHHPLPARAGEWDSFTFNEHRFFAVPDDDHDALVGGFPPEAFQGLGQQEGRVWPPNSFTAYLRHSTWSASAAELSRPPIPTPSGECVRIRINP